jgi:hypothetical protein
VADDLGGHRGIGRRELPIAVTPEEEDVRLERLALVRLEPVHEQPLALADAVLLPAQ